MVSQRDSRWVQARDLIDFNEGVICRSQLLSVGFSRGEVRGQLSSGRLRTVFPGIYRLDGVVLRERGRWLAAQFMSRSGVLSHRSALALHELIRDAGPVRVVRECGSSRTGTALRRSDDGWSVSIGRTKCLPAEDLVSNGAIKAVCSERAVIDSARSLSSDEMRSVLNQGERSRVIDFGALDARLIEAKGRPGIADLQKVRVALIPEMEMAWSELEERTHALVDRGGLPRPIANHPIGRWVVDFFWPFAGLVVEVDGYSFHSDVEAFERDRRKDRELREMGYTVLRFTWSEIVNQPEMVIETIRRFLAQAR